MELYQTNIEILTQQIVDKVSLQKKKKQKKTKQKKTTIDLIPDA
jgi:hypothetical protein